MLMGGGGGGGLYQVGDLDGSRTSPDMDCEKEAKGGGVVVVVVVMTEIGGRNGSQYY